MPARTEADLTQSGLYVRETRLDMLPEDTPEFCDAISRFTRGVAGLALSSLVVRFGDNGWPVPVEPIQEYAIETVVPEAPVLELHVPNPQPGMTLYNYHPQIPHGNAGWNTWRVEYYGATSVEDGFDEHLLEPTKALCEGVRIDPAFLKEIVASAFENREGNGARGLPIRMLRLSWEVEAITNAAVSDMMYRLGLLDGPQPGAEVVRSRDAAQLAA